MIGYAAAAVIVLGLVGFEVFFGSAQEWVSGRALQITLLGLLVAGVSSVILLARRDRHGFVGLAAAAFAIAWLVVFFIGVPGGIVARATAADGTEMCVIETPGGETRQTGFYYRRPGQRWGWFYYEHEDSRWWLGRIRVSPDSTRAVLYRLFLPVAYFDIPTERFTIVRWGRTLGPAQRWMPEGWSPEKALDSVSSDAAPREFGAPNEKEPDMKNVPGPTPQSNQAMQLTASKSAIYASYVCHRASMLRGMHRGLAAADLVSR
jgi:hypothetical protein